MQHREQLENTQDAYRKDLNRQRKELREAEANGLSQEQIDTLKDDIAVREQVFRKLGLAVEERKLERQLIPRVRLLQPATPS